MFNVETNNGYVSLDLDSLSINDLKRLSTEVNVARLRKEDKERTKAIKEILDFISNKLDKVEGLDNCVFYYDDNDNVSFELSDIVKGLINFL